MNTPQTVEELLDILQQIESDEERSQLLKDLAKVSPIAVLELLLSNAQEEGTKNAILTSISLFRPDLFEEYLEKNKIVIPESVEELEEMVEELPDNRAVVMLLEAVKREATDIFESFFSRRREENKAYS